LVDELADEAGEGSVMRYQAVLIAGPTASGKSQLAMKLARETGGVVINADSMQVYDALRIVTARPGPADLAVAPHELYGFVAPDDAYSTGRYAADAARVYAACREARRTAIFVGGTGLYFKALLEGLSPIPRVPDDVRGHWRAERQRLGAAALHGVLLERDPGMAARLAPTDAQRIVRALEVLQATGVSLAEWQQVPGIPVVAEDDALRIVLAPGREEIYARCDRRFDEMVRVGALEEVDVLGRLGIDPSLPVMRAVGVPPLLAHVSGSISLEAAIERGKTDTRHYVKRQLTWLRRHMISWKWINVSDSVNYDEISFLLDQ
jgi:tRNA dimethylallyltransferase